MTLKSNIQSQELANKLWSIACNLRGNMDASKFKNYILGIIFYRYLSEKTENYLNKLLKDDNINYNEAFYNKKFSKIVKDWSIEHLGYIIEPKNLFNTFVSDINSNNFSIEQLENAIAELTGSTIGQESEIAFDKLFDDMNLQDKDLGKEVSDRTELISNVILKIKDISFNVDDSEIDVLGTAYMILIGLFASDAGKKGGEFFTPTCASKLVAKLATVGLKEVNNACDSCAGSGSLLLEVKNQLSTKKIGHIYATEKIGSTYNLLRMNLLMHGVPYKKFTTFNDDSVKSDNYYENGIPITFDVQVENPPYSQSWDMKGKRGTNLLDDPRYSGCGVLPPKAYEDLAFVLSMVYHMSDDGRIVCLLPHGVLFRKGTELTIRKYLIDHLNYIDAIIGLPSNMFHGTTIPVCIMVLKKKRNGNSDNIFFIDASNEYIVEKNQNSINDEMIEKIVKTYSERKNINKYSYKASLKEVLEINKCNLNIPRYVNSFEKEEIIDVNKEIKEIAKINHSIVDTDKKLKLLFKKLGL